MNRTPTHLVRSQLPVLPCAFVVLFCAFTALLGSLAAPLTAQSGGEQEPAKAEVERKPAEGENPIAGMVSMKMPQVYCETCIRERRVKDKRHDLRLIERDGRDVIAYVKKKPVHYLEWKHIKFVCQIPSVNLAVEMQPKCAEEKRNLKFLRVEIADLKPLFPGIRAGTLNSHQMAHLFMNRLIRYYRTFEKEMKFWKAVDGLVLADYGMGPHLGMRSPFEIYVLKGENNYLRWEDKFIGRRSIAGQKWHLFTDRSLVFTTYYYGNVKLFNNFLMHNFSHLLLWGYRGWTFKLPGWMHIGYAHFVERSITPKFNTLCFDEGGEPETVKGWRWAIKVRKAVVSSNYTPFPELKPRVEMAEFIGNDHLICWSLVKYMIEHDPAKWRELIELISRPGRMSQDDALKKSYGWSFNVLEEQWREHVLATYPKP